MSVLDLSLSDLSESANSVDGDVLASLESEVRTYCRTFPATFARAVGSHVYDAHGRPWLDFVSGAGALNYGHNHPVLKGALLEYIARDGIVSSLDLVTEAKRDFLTDLATRLLSPRGLSYKVQFCGPTGTNSVEAALRLGMKVTGRSHFACFSNSYHGMTPGAMAVSASFRRRNDSYFAPGAVTFLPFDGFTGLEGELEYVRCMLTKHGSGLAPPAAFIVELVQGEGGVNVARESWVRDIRELARTLGALFIVDDIQAGCGRTGRFFSFEHYGIIPDLVCVSKSISGFGFPMSLLLINPELDAWSPGEFTGTFRGFNYAFVTAREVIRQFWDNPTFVRDLDHRTADLTSVLAYLMDAYGNVITSSSQLGMFAGLTLAEPSVAAAVQRRCFEDGLLIELCGSESNILKFLPPITVSVEELGEATEVLSKALGDVSRDA